MSLSHPPSSIRCWPRSGGGHRMQDPGDGRRIELDFCLIPENIFCNCPQNATPS
ncbi:hypothetical protein B0H12DRAFT_1103729 [Mycena haematopus]|nr:hypothetical protein B0H12DRAFT_1103729 [Mycena haematopus]